MRALELKVPPPAVVLLIGAAMWGASLIGAPIPTPDGVRHIVAAAIALAGGGISLAGVISFRRAKTTVSPLKPENASSLVTGHLQVDAQSDVPGLALCPPRVGRVPFVGLGACRARCLRALYQPLPDFPGGKNSRYHVRRPLFRIQGEGSKMALTSKLPTRSTFNRIPPLPATELKLK
jgi:hypothetical protein